MTRRLVALAAWSSAVAAILFLALTGGHAQAQSFVDVRPSDRFYDAVETLAGLGVLHNDIGAEFGPYEPETRAEFAFSLAALLNLAPLYGSAFDDVSPGDWFSGAVGSLYWAGLVQGTGDGRFDPDVELSRQQAATLLMRGYSYGPGAGRDSGGGLLADESQIDLWLQGFKDRAAIASGHRAAVASAYRLGIVSGFDDGRFYPFLNLTRAQAAVILYEALMLTPVPRTQPPESVVAEAGYPVAGEGARGPVVAWMEHRLADLSYQPGTVDGIFDRSTAEAVMAFEKIEGLERTGTAGTPVFSGLVSAERPLAREYAAGTRIEVDLTRQVLLFIVKSVVQKTIPIASGRSGWLTPTGTFSAERKLPYWRRSSLGLLYKPVYFHGGYAIHGSYSVPPYPASHGCVRVSVATMEVLYPLIALGTRVDVYY